MAFNPPRHPTVGATHPEIRHVKAFYDADEATELFRKLSAELNFQPDRLMMGGRLVETKRLVDFRGAPGVGYRYSGSHHDSAPWTPCLVAILARLETECSASFNACLCNRYADGAIGMGWHSDDEPELGASPTIASISLGQERLFRLRRKKPWREPSPYETWNFELGDGDLLIMSGRTQDFFEHELPGRAAAKEARINLTFRKVMKT